MVQNKNYNPKQHEEQARAKREKAMAEITALLDGLAYWQLRYRLWFTGKYYPIREESCFVLGTAWPVLRPMAAELGQRFVEVGTLVSRSEIYFLYTSEIEPVIEARRTGRGNPRLPADGCRTTRIAGRPVNACIHPARSPKRSVKTRG